VVKIITPTLRIQRPNSEVIAGVLIVVCLAVTLLSSVVLSMLTVKADLVTAAKDFHYVVKVENQEFNLVPEDVLRIVRTPAKKAFTGQEIEILKVYTSKGFIYATPDDLFYDGTKKLAGAVDFYSLLEWNKKGISTDDVKQRAYAIGTQKEKQNLVFIALGLQNMALFAASFALVILVFPLRFEKESDSARVVTRVEQPA